MSPPKESDTARLVRFAWTADLFQSDGVGYADFEIAGHRETAPINSSVFRGWLELLFFQETKSAPSSEAIKAALNTIEAAARFGGPERPVYVRIGRLNDKIYIDLANQTWQAVEVDESGWHIIDKPLVRFLRPSGMKPLPRPTGGGNINSLRPFLNVGSDADFVVVVSWVLGCFRVDGPFPILVVSGEQGSTKSTFAKILRALVDPNIAPLRPLPRNERDLFIAAGNARVLAFDNLSTVPNWMSDALCRVATGGGFATRKNYTDQDEILIDVARPILVNGIEEVVTRPDLADRAIPISLGPLPEGKRRPENELWNELENEAPGILGSLLDAVAEGIKNLPTINPPKLPRMADFAKWVMACETKFWPAGTFLAAYDENRLAATEDVIANDDLATAVRTMMTVRTVWIGTASDLLKQLGWTAYGTGSSARAIAGRLRRVATDLRRVGIDVAFDRRGHGRIRTITIKNANPTSPSPAPSPSPSSSSSSNKKSVSPSASSAPTTKINLINGVTSTTMQTVADDADGAETSADGSASRAAGSTGSSSLATADGADASLSSATPGGPDNDLTIPDFLDRAKNPRPGDAPPKPRLN